MHTLLSLRDRQQIDHDLHNLSINYPSESPEGLLVQDVGLILDTVEDDELVPALQNSLREYQEINDITDPVLVSALAAYL